MFLFQCELLANFNSTNAIKYKWMLINKNFATKHYQKHNSQRLFRVQKTQYDSSSDEAKKGGVLRKSNERCSDSYLVKWRIVLGFSDPK